MQRLFALIWKETSKKGLWNFQALFEYAKMSSLLALCNFHSRDSRNMKRSSYSCYTQMVSTIRMVRPNLVKYLVLIWSPNFLYEEDDQMILIPKGTFHGVNSSDWCVIIWITRAASYLIFVYVRLQLSQIVENEVIRKWNNKSLRRLL